MKKNIIGGVVFVVVLISSIVGLFVWLQTNFDPKRDRLNQEHIGSAYIKFYQDRGVRPFSIEVLVKAGYLPLKGSFYIEPKGLWQSDVDYGKTCYKIFPFEYPDSLKIIGRRVVRGGEEHWEFDPVSNMFIISSIKNRK